MSVTFFDIRCDQCNFLGTSLATSGCYLWEHEAGVFQFERQLGLCLDCNEVVAIEDFPNDATMKRAREIHKTYTGKPLLRFLEKDYAKYLASQKGFTILEKVLMLQRSPVCLVCGNSSVLEMRCLENLAKDEKRSLGFGHPGCSGTLYAQSAGALRFGIRPATYTYDIDGQLISTTYN